MATDSPKQKAGDVIKARVTPEEASKLVEDLYELKPMRLKELNGYDTVNYKVKIDPDHSDNKYVLDKGASEFVLKIAASTLSEDLRQMEVQNRIMTFLNKAGFNCQLPISSVNGNLIELHKFYTPINTAGEMKWRSHAVRLLTFLQGDILFNVPLTLSLCTDVGVYVAKIDKKLSELNSELHDTDIPQWSLVNIPHLEQFVYAISNTTRRQLVTDVINEFKTTVTPVVENFQKGVIHGDPNEQNIIVTQNGNNEWKVSGILDWEDSCLSYPSFDLAMIITYLMLCHRTESTVKDIADIGKHAIQGFLSEHPLAAGELEFLPLLVAGRFAQSLVMGEYSYRVIDPSNEYFLVTSVLGWEQLELLWTRRQHFSDVWFDS